MNRIACLMVGMSVAVVAACAGEAPSGLNIPPGNYSGGTGGEGTGGEAPAGSAKELYLETVHDDLVTVCGTCHAAGVVGAPIYMDNNNPEASYNLITSYPGNLGPPTSSKLVIYGAHTGPALDDASNPPLLYDHVVTWLAQEAEERGMTGGVGGAAPTGPTFEEAMVAFADCMRLDVWTGMGMDIVPLQQTNKGPCLGCHQAPNGVGGLVLDDDTTATFAATKKKHNLLKYVTGAYDDNGKFLQLVPAGRLIEKPGEPCLFENPDDCHPDYVLSTQAIDAINGFVIHTLDALENDSCDVPYDPMQ